MHSNMQGGPAIHSRAAAGQHPPRRPLQGRMTQAGMCDPACRRAGRVHVSSAHIVKLVGWGSAAVSRKSTPTTSQLNCWTCVGMCRLVRLQEGCATWLMPGAAWLVSPCQLLGLCMPLFDLWVFDGRADWFLTRARCTCCCLAEGIAVSADPLALAWCQVVW